LRTAAVGEEAMSATTTFRVPTLAMGEEPAFLQAIPPDDGHSWRNYKYREKRVKVVYYKCRFPDCPVMKKVEAESVDGESVDGEIRRIVYKGTHNHAMQQNTSRGSGTAAQLLQTGGGEASDYTFGGMSGVTVATLEKPSASVGNDDVVGVRSLRSTGCSGLDEHEKDPKRLRKDGCLNA